jgi:hypothetical protein
MHAAYPKARCEKRRAPGQRAMRRERLPSASTSRLAQAIDNDQRRRDLQHRDLELLSVPEALGGRARPAFHKPDSPAATDALPSSGPRARPLYKRVASTIAERFINGHRFVHDLPNVEVSTREGVQKT